MPLAHRSIETLPHQSNPRWVQPWQGHPHPSARGRPPLLGSSSQSIDMGQKIVVKRYNNRPPDQASLLAFFECFSRLTPLVNTNCASRLTPRAFAGAASTLSVSVTPYHFSLLILDTQKAFVQHCTPGEHLICASSSEYFSQLLPPFLHLSIE